jgi:hypothetical protein
MKTSGSMKTSNSLWQRLRRRLTGRTARHPSETPSHQDLRSLDRSINGGVKLFVVVEGANDIQFLRRISGILHADDPRLPDLGDMERRGELVFVPFGGGDLWLWAFRLAGLGRAEFHLYDRDMPPETDSRRRVTEVVNLRPGCRAVLTKKRNLENYLHAEAIFEASGIGLCFSDDDYVAELVARHGCQEGHLPWEKLPVRARKRRRDRAKKWLNTKAVDSMTPERLAEQDSDGEVRSWLTTIAALAANCPRHPRADSL